MLCHLVKSGKNSTLNFRRPFVKIMRQRLFLKVDNVIRKVYNPFWKVYKEYNLCRERRKKFANLF
jgi:hypothetical protein